MTPQHALYITLLCALSPLIGCEDPKRPPNEQSGVDQGLVDQRPPPVDQRRRADQTVDLARPELDRTLDAALPLDQAPRWDLESIEGPAWAEVPEASEALLVGVATRPLGYPLGSAVVGFGPREGAPSPFASLYPGTDHQHTALTAKALVFRRAGEAVVLVRLDMIGVWQDLVADLQGALRDAGRGDLARGLVLAATHTHASGGRIFDHPIGTLAVGFFYPAFYQRIRAAILEAVLEADAHAEESVLSAGVIQVPELHKDRRCANGPVQDDAMVLLKVESLDGNLRAVAINYAMHGTVIANDQQCLSGDAPHAIEDAVESRLRETAPVLYFQSWAGDMAPRTPEGFSGEGRGLREEYEDLDALGAAAAARIIPALDTLRVEEDPMIGARTYRFPLQNALVNPDGSFDRYPNGGIYCMTEEENCPPSRRFTPEELSCFPIQRNATIDWSQITAARLGSWGLVTLPGEPLTSVGVELRDRAIEESGLSGVMVVGYAQGYLSYLLHPDDYFLGGYEGHSALLGPGLGVYLIERGVDAIRWLTEGRNPAYPPVARPEVAALDAAPLRVEEALGEASWLEGPARDEARGALSMRWLGGDPAADAPIVTIERWQAEAPSDLGAPAADRGVVDQAVGDQHLSDQATSAGRWAPLLHQSGLPVSSEGPEIELSLATEPSYADEMGETPRRFIWRAAMPLQFPTSPSFGQPRGRLRFIIEGKRPAPYRLVSEPVDL
ncbi:MAG: neutral/alkaline non-lysosomal ceramidase N-terminal domain-containing protein [Myxococcota bacterium]|nr:neutral/alkaline non-lysosomal ceramidase N-terminal domain-containing protein [Myxococcota bacterium]